MPNPYTFILGLFIIGGVITTVWGCRIIVNARQSLRWPTVEGRVDRAEAASDSDDLLPLIEFSYTVSGTRYQNTLAFPGGTTPTPEFTRLYLDRYPAGSTVTVHYDPQQPGRATLEPGMARGDWMIAALGLLATGIGTAMLLMGV